MPYDNSRASLPAAPDDWIRDLLLFPGGDRDHAVAERAAVSSGSIQMLARFQLSDSGYSNE